MTERPRVVLLTPTLALGGAELHTAYLALGLDPDRFAAHVITVQDGPYRARLDAAGIPVTVLDGSTAARQVPRLTRLLRRHLRRLRPALVMVQNNQIDVPARLALRGSRIPYVVWKHTYGNKPHLIRRERRIERLLGRDVTRYQAVCHTQVRYLTDTLAIPADRIGVICNSIPDAEPAAPPADLAELVGRPTVLMAAALREDKGHDDVLDAWPQVLARVPQATLLVAGDGPRLEHLVDRIAADGLTGSVRLLGRRDDVPALLEQSSVLLLASWFVECFPYAALEAMQRGVPVVSSSVGGVPEMIDDGISGLLFPRRARNCLAGVLVRVLAEPDLAAGLGSAARRRVAEVFPFQNWLRQVNDLAENCAVTR